MTNLNNFAGNQFPPYPKYTISRVIANKKDDLLDIEVPADFSNKLLENNIEINLYSLSDNSLVLSDFIRTNKNNVFYTEQIQYNDGTFRRILYIDFAKVNTELNREGVNSGLLLPSGRYSVTLNFFADEVGAYDNRILKVNKISTSRTEVELVLTDTSQQSKLEQFAIPRIPVEYINDVLIQIFNQEGVEEVSVPTSPVKIDSSSVYDNFGNNYGQQLIVYGFDEDAEDGQRPGINTITQEVLDIAYPLALKAINTQIKASSSGSLTEVELSNFVVSAIDEAYDTIIYDQTTNPSKYRFDLI